MQPIVAPLTDADIKDLAVYYAAQTPQGLEADPSYWKAGERLYRRGDAARNIPACIACHGPHRPRQPRCRLSGAARAALRLHGEAAERLRERHALSGCHGTDKPASPNAPIMATIAKRLTPEEIRDVASYIQGMR